MARPGKTRAALVAAEEVITPAPAPARVKVGWEAWWMLAVLSFFCLLSFVDRYILTMLVEPIQADLGIGDFEMGLILGPAFGVMLGLTGLPLGYLVDKWSRRRVVALGVGFWSLATMSCGFAQSSTALFMSRVGVGGGEAALGPAVTSLLADKFPRDRLSTALGFYNAGMKLGQATAFGVGGLLLGLLGTTVIVLPFIGELQPWQLVFILVGLPGLFSALLAFTFAEPRRLGKRSGATDKSTKLWGFLKANAKLMGLMYGGFAVVSLVAYSLTSWVPTFVSRRYGWEPEHYGPALALVNIVAAAALILKGTLVDRLYAGGGKDAPVRFYSWLLIGSIPIGLYIFFAPNAWLFLGLYAILQVITIPSMMYLSASLALAAPNELRGQLSGLAFTLYSILGLGIGPTLVGALTDFVFQDPAKVGLSLTIVLGGGLPLGAVLLRLAMKPLRGLVEGAEELEKETA